VNRLSILEKGASSDNGAVPFGAPAGIVDLDGVLCDVDDDRFVPFSGGVLGIDKVAQLDEGFEREKSGSE